jgi:hypothetical protein
MANATADRNTPKQVTTAYFPQYRAKAKAATKHYIGTVQCIDLTTDVSENPAVANAATQKGWGVVKETVDNLTGIAGAKTVELETGEFWFGVHGTHAPTLADRGKSAYMDDNQLISDTDTDGPLVGKILDVDATLGVLVGIGPLYW